LFATQSNIALISVKGGQLKKISAFSRPKDAAVRISSRSMLT